MERLEVIRERWVEGEGVGIEPGGDEKNLEAGETIALTQSAIVLENLIGQFLFSKAADAGSGAGTATTAPGGKK